MPAGLVISLTFLGMACVSPAAESPAGLPAVAGGAEAPGKAGPPNATPSAPPTEIIHLDRIYLRDGEVKTGRDIALRDDVIFMTSAGVERSYKVEAVDRIESVTKDPAFWMSVTQLALRKGNGRLAFDAALREQQLHAPKASAVAVLRSPNFCRLAISLRSADAAVDTLRKVRDGAAADRDGIVARIRAAEQDMDRITAGLYARLSGPAGTIAGPELPALITCPTCGGTGYVAAPASPPVALPRGGRMGTRTQNRETATTISVICPTCGGTGLIASAVQTPTALPDYQPDTTADQVALRTEAANERSLLEELKKANARLQPIEEELAAAAKQRDETEAKLREECSATRTGVFAPPGRPEEKKSPVPGADASDMPPAGQVYP